MKNNFFIRYSLIILSITSVFTCKAAEDLYVAGPFLGFEVNQGHKMSYEGGVYSINVEELRGGFAIINGSGKAIMDNTGTGYSLGVAYKDISLTSDFVVLPRTWIYPADLYEYISDAHIEYNVAKNSLTISGTPSDVNSYGEVYLRCLNGTYTDFGDVCYTLGYEKPGVYSCAIDNSDTSTYWLIQAGAYFFSTADFKDFKYDSTKEIFYYVVNKENIQPDLVHNSAVFRLPQYSGEIVVEFSSDNKTAKLLPWNESVIPSELYIITQDDVIGNTFQREGKHLVCNNVTLAPAPGSENAKFMMCNQNGEWTGNVGSLNYDGHMNHTGDAVTVPLVARTTTDTALSITPGTYDFDIHFAGSTPTLTVTASNNTQTFIDDVTVSSYACEYYTLFGTPCATPVSRGIYIVKEGSTYRKVLVK